MSRWNSMGRIGLLALMGASALSLAGCGKRGVLETPPPLFGDRARARYEAQQQQQAQDAADARARKGASNSTAAADQPDNAPLTTRDIKAPEQKQIPASRQSLDGAPNPLGPAINPNPPG
jgi:predicted small lipoprotein YifL